MNEKEDFFFMVYVEGEHTPAYKHNDLTSAETEAKRLAESLNRKAYVLCSIKSFEINTVSYTHLTLPTKRIV